MTLNVEVILKVRGWCFLQVTRIFNLIRVTLNAAGLFYFNLRHV